MNLLRQDPTSNQDEYLSAIRDLAAAIRGEPAAGDEPVEAVATGFQWNMESFKELALKGWDALKDFAPSLAGAAAILIIGWIVARVLTKVLRGILDRARVEKTLSNFLCSMAYATMMIFVLISAVGQLGVNTTSFVAILGAATFAVGFALQGSLSNFASGVMMILFRPIKQGDLVEAGGILGTVREVGVFATVIDTLENKKAIVANGHIMGGNIINYTSNGKLRVDMTFGIGYDDDIEKAKSIMMEILSKDSRVLRDPAPCVEVSGHGASSVDFVCRPFVAPEHYWDVWFDTHSEVKKQFDAQGISIPYPQRDVHMIPALA